MAHTPQSDDPAANAAFYPDRMPSRVLREFERWRGASKTERKAAIAEQASMSFRGMPHSSHSCKVAADFPHYVFLQWGMARSRQAMKVALSKSRASSFNLSA